MHSPYGCLSLLIASTLFTSLTAVDTNQIITIGTPIPPFGTNQTVTKPNLPESTSNATGSIASVPQESPFDRLVNYIKRTNIIPPIMPATRDDVQEKIEPVTDPILLVCVLMIKDENHDRLIEQMLDSYVHAGFKHFLIYEGGKSSDGTVEATEKYFKDHGIVHGYVVRGTFGEWITNPDTQEKIFIINFASARNRALEAARQKFPNAAFATFGDGEWYLRNGEKLFEFCQAHANELDTYIYSMRIMNSGTDFDTPRLIRLKGGLAQFVGRVHEVPLPTGVTPRFAPQVPRDVYFELGQSAIGSKKSQERWKKDAQALTLDHLEKPNDPRPLFYLGQTYDGLTDTARECFNGTEKVNCFSPTIEGYNGLCCKEHRQQVIDFLEKAYDFYTKRSAIQSWDQEDAVTKYRLGNIAERLVDAGSKNHSWAEAEHLYLQAYNMRPSRIEPLVQLAEHEWNTNINTNSPEKHLALAFLYARRAAETPYPKDDLLFINKWMYDFKRYEQLSKIAAYVGECAIGKWATEYLIDHHENIQWHRNLRVYEKCKLAATDLMGYNTTCCSRP